MSQPTKPSRKRIAVFFGGRSPEHDVSVVTALQVLQALDSSRFDAFPVYITPDGKWLTGDILRERKNYLLSATGLKETQQVTLDVTTERVGRLIPVKSGLFGGGKAIEFDVALPSFHGLYGEDGNIQGLFEMCGVPYTGITFFSWNTTQLITPFAAAVLGLTLNQAAFASEIVRGGPSGSPMI